MSAARGPTLTGAALTTEPSPEFFPTSHGAHSWVIAVPRPHRVLAALAALDAAASVPLLDHDMVGRVTEADDDELGDVARKR